MSLYNIAEGTSAGTLCCWPSKRSLEADQVSGRICSTLVTLLLLLSPAQAQIRKTDREHALLKGPVRKVVVEVAKLSHKSGRMVEQKRELVLSCTYDRNGNLMEAIDRDPSDGHVNKYVVTYDEKGSRREKVYFLNMTARSGQVASGYKWQGDESIHVTREYKYDPAGNRIEETVLQAGETLWYGNWYRYDGKGNMIERAHYNTEGWKYRWTYTLNDRDVTIGGTKLNPDGKLIQREAYEYEFDAAGNWTRRVTSKWVREKGKDSSVPMEVTYQVIEYY
jgi:hypothetical protein